MVSVVIPTHNRKDHVMQLLAEIKAQILPEPLSLKIIVVADGCKDGTVEAIAGKYADVEIVEGPGDWWFTRSLNAGCGKAMELGTDFILTINDDCSVLPDFVHNLYGAYSTINKKGAMGAITLIRSAPFRVTFSGARTFNKLKVQFTPYLDNRKEIQRSDLKGIYPTFSLMTRGLLFPVEVAKELNFFDAERFPQYGSDEDFALRLLKKGYVANVCWEAQVVDKPYLTSTGSVMTNPGFKAFARSFFNKYSVNSLVKTIGFQKQHGYFLLLPFNLLFFILGTSYAYFWKYRYTEIKK